MLVSILVSPRIAIMTNIMMSILAGFLGGFDLPVVVMMLLTGILGAGMVSRTHHRSTFILAGLAVSLVSLLVIFSEGILSRADIYKMLNNGLYGVIGGTLSAVLTIGTLPVFETVFDIITPLKFGIVNPNQPMLRRLLIELPVPTITLIGGKLARQGEDRGANPLLCRVGAYYHALENSKGRFLQENQITG
jgi:membrane-associated HD superfamily phosphohydrolase